MKEIKNIVCYIKEELQDSKKYLDKTAEAKTQGLTEIYQTAYKLAQDELSHALSWHDVAVNLINKKRQEMQQKGEKVPQFMLDTWNDEHKYYIEETAKIKYMIELLR